MEGCIEQLAVQLEHCRGEHMVHRLNKNLEWFQGSDSGKKDKAVVRGEWGLGPRELELALGMDKQGVGP